MSEVLAARRIVVGVDGSVASVKALRWAADQASLCHSELTVVRAWMPASAHAAPYVPVRRQSSPEDACKRADAELTAAIRTVFGPDPEVKLHEVLKYGPPAQVLLAEAADADLLVLGGHRSDTPLEHTVGATAAACLRRAPCPIVIITPARR